MKNLPEEKASPGEIAKGDNTTVSAEGWLKNYMYSGKNLQSGPNSLGIKVLILIYTRLLLIAT